LIFWERTPGNCQPGSEFIRSLKLVYNRKVMLSERQKAVLIDIQKMVKSIV
jgi:hypothetical protein